MNFTQTQVFLLSGFQLSKTLKMYDFCLPNHIAESKSIRKHLKFYNFVKAQLTDTNQLRFVYESMTFIMLRKLFLTQCQNAKKDLKLKIRFKKLFQMELQDFIYLDQSTKGRDKFRKLLNILKKPLRLILRYGQPMRKQF